MCEEAAILEAWQTYLEDLSKASEPPAHASAALPKAMHLTNLDAEISWDEVTRALAKCRSRKASGADAVPMEVYKLVQNEINPQSNLAIALLNCIRDYTRTMANFSGGPNP